MCWFAIHGVMLAELCFVCVVKTCVLVCVFVVVSVRAVCDAMCDDACVVVVCFVCGCVFVCL